MSKAFTTISQTITNKLTNNVTIKYNDKTLTVDALWDTGATNTCIAESLIQKLALKSTGKVNMYTPSGVAIKDTYLADIILPNNVEVPDLKLTAADLDEQGIGLLVGMDIINRGDFAVSNFKGQTVFSFRIPSEQKTSYVKDIRINNIVGKPHGKGNSKKRHKKKKK